MFDFMREENAQAQTSDSQVLQDENNSVEQTTAAVGATTQSDAPVQNTDGASTKGSAPNKGGAATKSRAKNKGTPTKGKTAASKTPAESETPDVLTKVEDVTQSSASSPAELQRVAKSQSRSKTKGATPKTEKQDKTSAAQADKTLAAVQSQELNEAANIQREWKEVKPIIKNGYVRDRSEIEETDEIDEFEGGKADVVSDIETGEADNANNVGAQQQESSEDDIESDKPESGAQTNSNGVVVLKRTRGEVSVDGNKHGKDRKGEDDAVAAAPAVVKKRNIVEVESKTYDGSAPAAAEKVTFKQYMKGVGVKIARGWDSFIHRKGAVRFLALCAVFVVLVVVMIIYASANRTNIKDIFGDTCRAFVYETGEVTGTGSYKKIETSELAKDIPNEKYARNYQFIEFTGKDMGKTIPLEKIEFGIYTDDPNLRVLVKLTIYYGDTPHLTLNLSETPAQRVGTRVLFQLSNQGIDFKGETTIKVEFACYDKTEYGNFGESADKINPAFVIYNLNYR